MGKFMIFTFLVLGVVFYEMSGGADFVPESRTAMTAEAAPAAAAPEPVQATRAETASLVNINLRVTRSAPQVDETVIEAAVFEAVATAPATAEPAVEAVAETPSIDLRYIAGNRVNVRSGPGTNFDRIDTVDGGTEAEVILIDDTSGWAQVRLVGSGLEGWVAERLLTR